MAEHTPSVGERLDANVWLDLAEFARACGVDAAFVAALVDEELLQPVRRQPAWRFAGDQLARVRRIRRLQRSFDASLASVAVMMDLLDEVERLRRLVERAGFADRP